MFRKPWIVKTPYILIEGEEQGWLIIDCFTSSSTYFSYILGTSTMSTTKLNTMQQWGRGTHMLTGIGKYG
jgi:hypothetical protein